MDYDDLPEDPRDPCAQCSVMLTWTGEGRNLIGWQRLYAPQRGFSLTKQMMIRNRSGGSHGHLTTRPRSGILPPWTIC